MAGLTSTIVRDAPRLREIVEAMKKRIVAGEFGPGDRIPSVTDLAAIHGASTRTAQNALRYLQETGFVTSRSGAGSYVSKTPPHLTHFALVFIQAPNPDGWWSQFYRAWKREAERFAAPDGEGTRRGFRFSYYFLNERMPGGSAEQELLDGLQDHRFAGMICRTVVQHIADTEAVKHSRTPKVVCVNKPTEGFIALNLDGRVETRALTYLAQRGRRKVAFIMSSAHRREPLPTDKLIRYAADCGLTSHRHWVHSADIEASQWAANLTELICSYQFLSVAVQNSYQSACRRNEQLASLAK